MYYTVEHRGVLNLFETGEEADLYIEEIVEREGVVLERELVL